MAEKFAVWPIKIVCAVGWEMICNGTAETFKAALWLFVAPS